MRPDTSAPPVKNICNPDPFADVRTTSNPAEPSAHPYAEFRADGWPFCPRCGEDELYSVLMLNWNGQGEKPTLEQCIAGVMRCYKCEWASDSTNSKTEQAKEIECTLCREPATHRMDGTFDSVEDGWVPGYVLVCKNHHQEYLEWSQEEKDTSYSENQFHGWVEFETVQEFSPLPIPSEK